MDSLVSVRGALVLIVHAKKLTNVNDPRTVKLLELRDVSKSELISAYCRDWRDQYRRRDLMRCWVLSEELCLRRAGRVDSLLR